MDTILLIITGFSLAAAAGMAALFARSLRDERRRSDARVALLTDLATQAPAPAVRARTPQPVQAIRRASPQPNALDDFALHPSEPERREEVGSVQDLFQEQAEPSAWPRRFAVIGGLAAFILVLGLGLSAVSSREADPTTAIAQSGAATAPAPLELLSLRHAQQDGALIITGLVQNPRSASALANVKATLFVFGPGGTFITSGRAPLDFTTLAPGDESPFVIRVPVSSDVARYRIGFRGDDDRVLAHIDRRTAETIAQRSREP